MSEVLSYKIDADTCPKEDNIIFKDQCGGCEFYRGFEMHLGSPCIKCDYCSSLKNDE